MRSSQPVEVEEEVTFTSREFGLLDHVPVGACILRPDLTILYWNRSLEEWSGLSRAILLGTSLGEHFPHLTTHGFMSRFQSLTNGGPPIIFSSQLHPHLIPSTLPNGQKRVQYSTAKGVPLSGVDGLCVLLMIQDVTALSTRVQEYREARDQALQEVEERQQIELTLLAQSQELERSNEELVQFAAIASHDLQEPLRKVITFADRLKIKYGESLDQTGQDYLDRMQKATRRMQQLISDLLSYSRVTTKALPVEKVNLGDIVHEVVGDLEGRIDASKGRIEISDLPTIEAEPFQMRQLFQNLIGNALKYCRNHVPPIVTISAQIMDAGCHKASGRRYWQIEVTDNGVGFEEQYADRIFGIFQRLHGKADYEGTGVGLAICKKIVDRHNGLITAKSVPGQGATFIVQFLELPSEVKA